ncbi:MAG: T9SS type A sorting domain-containing protein [bacterium]|nr:T9SS type A sorting domain-containing protein [bacterium]
MVLNRYSTFQPTFISCLLVLGFCHAQARPLERYNPPDSGRLVLNASASQTLEWPAPNFEFSTNEFRSNMTGFGQIGRPYSTEVPGSVKVHSFESPAGSEKEYLFGGGIWVGGIVGQDTLVSIAVDGWLSSRELLPVGFPSPGYKGVLNGCVSPAQLGVSAIFDDTIHSGTAYTNDHFDDTRYRPLNLLFANRGYVWDGEDAQYCLVYDLVITNICPDTIRQGYVGFYFDPDIGLLNSAGYLNDVAGSIPSERIGYVVDIDGDLEDSVTFERGFAAKVLYTSFGGRANFNWYVGGGGGLGALDYGPMLRANERDFGTGGTGYPLGDRNKYHVLSAPEWDFDQVMTSRLAGNAEWLPQSDTLRAYDLINGWDVRFLLSAGPFDLLPDSSVRIQYALLTAADIHTDPHIKDFLELAPELYVQSLHLDGLIAHGRIADSLASLLRDPTYPPTNLRTSVVTGDSIIVSWDPWVGGGIDGYQLLGQPIPLEEYRHAGVSPPWYSPDSLPIIVTTEENDLTLNSLPHSGGYTFAVRHMVGGESRLNSPTMAVTVPTALTPPVPIDTMLYVKSDESARLRWSASAGAAVRQYNIYRFPDTVAANNWYPPHYSTNATGDEIDTVSEGGIDYYFYAITPFATVGSDETEFVDNGPSSGSLYLVTAIDSSGFESDHASHVQVWTVDEPQKDFLVLTHGLRFGSYTVEDSIDQFYQRVLQGYDYDIYSLADSLAGCHPTLPACLDWRLFTRYKIVIVDDNIRDHVLRNWYEDEEHGFARFLGYKGVLVYCGQFANLGGPEFNSYTMPQWYSRNSALVNQYFGVDSIFAIGWAYYRNRAVAPYVDSLLAFSYVVPVADAPEVRYDSTRSTFQSILTNAWPSATPSHVSAFRPDSLTTVIYQFGSSMPATSLVETEPVGLMKQVDSTLTFTFGFHLWYLEQPGARSLIEWIYKKAQNLIDSLAPVTPTLPGFFLAQNYPNPFNPTTVIAFSLPERSRVTVEVFNILGQRVRRLLDEEKPSGDYRVVWNGTDQSGNQVASGVYLYRLQAADRVTARKMVLLR